MEVEENESRERGRERFTFTSIPPLMVIDVCEAIDADDVMVGSTGPFRPTFRSRFMVVWPRIEMLNASGRVGPESNRSYLELT